MTVIVQLVRPPHRLRVNRTVHRRFDDGCFWSWDQVFNILLEFAHRNTKSTIILYYIHDRFSKFKICITIFNKYLVTFDIGTKIFVGSMRWQTVVYILAIATLQYILMENVIYFKYTGMKHTIIIHTYYYIIMNSTIILSLLNIQSWSTKISVNNGIESMSRRKNVLNISNKYLLFI